MLWTRLVTYLVIAVTIFSAGWAVNGWRLGEKIERIKGDHSKAVADAQAKARNTERKLQEMADKLRVEKNAQIHRLNRRVADLTNSLQDRPSRTDPQTSVPGQVAQGCSGASLFRQDAEFLVREAARADTIREAYKECSALYEVVR